MDRFFDAQTDGPLQLDLRSHDGSRFRVLRPLGYRDPHHDRPFVVPADPAAFLTDLVSVPWFFAWLMPKTGPHLPAAVLHDGLVADPGEGASYSGPVVSRVEADRIFRDAMVHLGTPVVRAWLAWTAVTLPTAWRTLRPRWWWRLRVAGVLGLVAVLGVLATLDLFDVVRVLPWMWSRPWTVELALGAVFAVLVPLALSLTWGRLWRAAAIASIALALLLHVTAAVVAVYGVYVLAERLAARLRA